MSPSDLLIVNSEEGLLGRIGDEGQGEERKELNPSSQPAGTEALENWAVESYSTPFVRCVWTP